MGAKVYRGVKENLATIQRRIFRAKNIIFFLDCDGTLTPIRKEPKLVRLDRRVKSVLKKLANKSWSKVYIVSGRSLKDVKSLVGIRSLYYIGNHGIELEGPHLKYVNPRARRLRGAIQDIYRLLKKQLNCKGVIVENKSFTLSFHYRLVRSRDVARIKRLFNDIIEPFKKAKKIKVTRGKKVLEVRPNVKWDKGKIIQRIMQKSRPSKALHVYIGDDMTDEDAFRVLRKRDIGIVVSKGNRKSFADYRVQSPRGVIDFLEFALLLKVRYA